MKGNYWFYERGEGDPDPKPLTLSHIMHCQVETLGPSDTVRDAMRLMKDNGFHHIPVVEGGKVVGMVSDRDLWQKVLHGNLLTKEEEYHASLDALLPLSKVMSAPVYTLPSGEKVAKAISVLLTHKVHAVVVVDGGKVAGMVTEKDLLKLMGHMVE